MNDWKETKIKNITKIIANLFFSKTWDLGEMEKLRVRICVAENTAEDWLPDGVDVVKVDDVLSDEVCICRKKLITIRTTYLYETVKTWLTL